jgi:hypothetical protein
MTITIDAETAAAIRNALRDSAFKLETVAHLRGLERELLPAADENRRLIEFLTLESNND